jgi:hypothetical protein
VPVQLQAYDTLATLKGRCRELSGRVNSTISLFAASWVEHEFMCWLLGLRWSVVFLLRLLSPELRSFSRMWVLGRTI